MSGQPQRNPKRGGVRRAPVPEYEQDYLKDLLRAHVNKVGVMECFAFGDYTSVQTSQGIRGVALVRRTVA